MKDLARLLVPVDVIDYLNLHEEIEGDLAFSILIALVKEPTATRTLHREWKRWAPGVRRGGLAQGF